MTKKEGLELLKLQIEAIKNTVEDLGRVQRESEFSDDKFSIGDIIVTETADDTYYGLKVGENSYIPLSDTKCNDRRCFGDFFENEEYVKTITFDEFLDEVKDF